MVTIEQKKVRELSENSFNISIVGLIISKTEPNVFQSKTTLENRGIMTITIRDSQKDFINCKLWCSKEKIEEYNQSVHIYDVVKIVCPKVIPTIDSEQELQQFQPITSVSYVLVLNEGSGFLERLQDETLTSDLLELIGVPIKPLWSAMHLSDIDSNEINDCNLNEVQLVDLLVIVRVLRPAREIHTKTGKLMQCLDLAVIDESLHSGVVLTIWSKEWIQRAEKHWRPLTTVLHLIDVRVGYSKFHKCTVLGMGSRSLIIENPKSTETDNLLNFALKTALPQIEIFNQSNALPKPETIITVMTVKQIYERAEGKLMDSSEEFTAVLFGMVSKFDIDGFYSITSKKCITCGKRIFGQQLDCINEKCLMSLSFDMSKEKFEYFFDINVHLTDHTGTLVEARLSADVAERILQISIQDFQKTNDDQKDILKWKFLLDKFRIKLVVKKPNGFRKKLAVIIVDMIKVQLTDVAENLLVF